MEEEQDDDHPCPQAVVLSQTCWEYWNLLGQERASASQEQQQQQGAPGVSIDLRRKAIPAGTPAAAPTPTSASVSASASICSETGRSSSSSSSGDGEPTPKRIKTAVTATPRAGSPRRRAATETTRLQTLRLAGKGEVPNKRSGSWDIFVLVLQASGLQQITSKAGAEIDFGTLLLADQSASFFRLTLWARAARAGARLIRPGDLVRFNEVAVSSFRGTVQASTTQITSFRVVWRGDAFTTPQDAPSTTMLSQGWSSPKGRGGRRRYQPAPPVLSQDDELAVPREDACALAAWAKREYPSVTSTETERHGQQAAAVGGVAGSLGSVRTGVEATVRACVLEASEVERLWMWESAGGKRRKDLVSRATALLTDGQHEMTLQLWGDMASDETVNTLREGAIAASRGARDDGAMRKKPAVFELTRLQPSFSFSCEALVLNGKSGTVRRMESDSTEAIAVSASVLAAAAAAAAADPPAAANGVAAGSTEHDETNPMRVIAAKSPGALETALFLAEEGGPAAARKFESVAALLSADGFSGAGFLANVVVRKFDAPSLSAPGIIPIPGCDGGSTPRSSRLPPPSRSGVDPPLTIYLGDPDEEAEPAKGIARSVGVGAVLPVTVGGGARGDLLGCIPEELLLPPPPTSGRARADDAIAHAGRAVVKSLLDGLVVGGGRGERVDVVLACSLALDDNERVIPGGARYRLVSLEPSYLSREMDNAQGMGIDGIN